VPETRSHGAIVIGLNSALAGLEAQIAQTWDEYGDRAPLMRTHDGSMLLAPLYAAQANAYAALATIKLVNEPMYFREPADLVIPEPETSGA